MQLVEVKPEEVSVRVVGLPAVEVMTGMGRMTIYRRLWAGQFPPSLKGLPGGRKLWRESDIIAWINEQAVDKSVSAGDDSPEPQA